jgi:hypothetical protein
MVIEYRVLSKLFGRMRKVGAGGLRKLCDQKIHNLYVLS